MLFFWTKSIDYDMANIVNLQYKGMKNHLKEEKWRIEELKI